MRVISQPPPTPPPPPQKKYKGGGAYKTCLYIGYFPDYCSREVPKMVVLTCKKL